MGYELVVSSCHGRRSGPMGADNGVCGAVVCDKGENPALRFKSSNAARHELTDRPGRSVRTSLHVVVIDVFGADSNAPAGSGKSSHRGWWAPNCITRLSIVVGEGETLLMISANM